MSEVIVDLDKLDELVKEGKISKEQAEEIKKILLADKRAKFFAEPIVLDKRELARIKFREILESIMKWAHFYIRKYEERHGIRVEYASAIRYNERGNPVLVIELLDLIFPEDIGRLPPGDKIKEATFLPEARGVMFKEEKKEGKSEGGK